MAAGLEVTNEEAAEVLSEVPSVLIGDPDTCVRKAERFAELGVDRLMCLTQFGRLPHRRVARGLQNVGEHLIPHFQGLDIAI